MRSRSIVALMAAFGLVVAVGCGASGPKTVEVSGTVTFDGEPVSEGDIIFKSADSSSGGSAGKIKDGKFAFPSLLGAKKVEITAMRDVLGKFDESNPGEKVQMRESYIPITYNTNTTLTADVTDSNTTFDFNLKSSP